MKSDVTSWIRVANTVALTVSISPLKAFGSDMLNYYSIACLDRSLRWRSNDFGPARRVELRQNSHMARPPMVYLLWSNYRPLRNGLSRSNN